MKNLIYILFILFTMTLVSCDKMKPLSKEERMQKSITETFLIDMNDPSTYEFVSMEINKKFTVKERKLVMNDDKLTEIIDLKQRGGDVDHLIAQMKKEIDFLKYKDDNMEAVYYVRFKARGANSFGAIILSTYSATILNDENLTVVNLKKIKE